MASIKFTNKQALLDISTYLQLTDEQKGEEPVCGAHGEKARIKSLQIDKNLLTTGAQETSVVIDGCCTDVIRLMASHCRRTVRQRKRAR